MPLPEFVVVIPARYASIRLPGKILREIHGRPMIAHVIDRARESGAIDIVVATDDKRIVAAAEACDVQACMTSAEHRSGTERIAEVAQQLNWDDELIVVNLQGDEPAMPAALIDLCAETLANSDADMATLASPLASRGGLRESECR